MDNDLSHEALTRFQALEDRVSALEEHTGVNDNEEETEVTLETEEDEDE